jgi:uncharacterized protein DUF3237
MAIELEHAFDYHALLKAPVLIGAGPSGTRVFYEVVGGEVNGPQIRGRVLAGGGDWALIGDDGRARLDVRGQFETDDGAFVYMAYEGIIELNEAMQRATASGGETGFDDRYFRTAPGFETGDDRYRWLTHSLFVARGRAYPGGVAYQVFRVS